MCILIIEDDRITSRSVELMLGGAGFEYETVGTGEKGFELARLYDYDSILLDLTLPDKHGYEVLQRLRIGHIDTPVIILTGNGDLEAKVAGLGVGADDYVTKPFQRAELIARVHAVVRRSKTHTRSIIVTGSLSVDLQARTAEINSHRVHVTGKEYAILEMLSLRKGTTLTKDMFMSHIYGDRDEPELKIIDAYICKLRKKLSTAGAVPYTCIDTVWGRGYSLRDPEVERQSRAAQDVQSGWLESAAKLGDATGPTAARQRAHLSNYFTSVYY